jgi:hypothetical protein
LAQGALQVTTSFFFQKQSDIETLPGLRKSLCRDASLPIAHRM